jgi:hypothetical protein
VSACNVVGAAKIHGYIDFGATSHVTRDKSFFSELLELRPEYSLLMTSVQQS